MLAVEDAEAKLEEEKRVRRKFRPFSQRDYTQVQRAACWIIPPKFSGQYAPEERSTREWRLCVRVPWSRCNRPERSSARRTSPRSRSRDSRAPPSPPACPSPPSSPAPPCAAPVNHTAEGAQRWTSLRPTETSLRRAHRQHPG